MNDAGVLSRREVRLLPDTAREEIAPAFPGQVRQPLADRGSSLLGDFELDRATGLLRDDDLSMPDPDGTGSEKSASPPRMREAEVHGEAFRRRLGALIDHAVVKYHDTDFGFLCPLPLPVFLEEDKGPDQQDEYSIAMPTLFLSTASESAKCASCYPRRR